MIDTKEISNIWNNGWTYLIISPVVNPSSSDVDDKLLVKIYETVEASGGVYDSLVA